jgi:hypothetical protein
MTKQLPKKQKQAAGEAPVPPLSLAGAPRGATQTGRSPEPDNKHAKRSATKRRLTKREDY